MGWGKKNSVSSGKKFDKAELKKKFAEVDKNKDGFITRQEFSVLCRDLQIVVSAVEKNILLASNKTSLDDIIKFLETSSTTTAAKPTKATENNNKAPKNNRTPIENGQKENLPAASSKKKKTHHKEEDKFKNINTVYRPKLTVYQDMTAPLSHYFISSGHNSYLTGNQMTSKSGVKPIQEALEAGCRVIELDVWSGRKGPRVLHGHTMTASVGLLKCIRCIKQYAFKTSSFPVIITIENHCNAKNKKMMGDMLQRELGSLIYTDSNAKNWNKFPSPRDLRNKILIRDKADDEEDDEKDAPGPSSAPAQTTAANTRVNTASTKQRQTGRGMDAKQRAKWEKLDKEEKEGKNAEVKEFNNLITIKNVKHHMSLQSTKPVSSSRNENVLELMEAELPKYIRHTQMSLVRTYPRANRVDSSNYDPWLAWSVGAQVVALNWQTPGPPMYVYRGMFKDNGNCGYIKKPKWMLGPNPPTRAEMPESRTIKVHILSARHMKHSKAKNNAVTVEMFGCPQDCMSERTSTVPAAHTCNFDQEFVFHLRSPETAVLLFTLVHEVGWRDEFVGQYAIPINNILLGKFVVPLLNKNGKRFNKLVKNNPSIVVNLQSVATSLRHKQASVGNIEGKPSSPHVRNRNSSQSHGRSSGNYDSKRTNKESTNLNQPASQSRGSTGKRPTSVGSTSKRPASVGDPGTRKKFSNDKNNNNNNNVQEGSETGGNNTQRSTNSIFNRRSKK